MHARFGIIYPELYRRMKLPVFDGVQEALERRNMQRKRKLEREKTTPVKIPQEMGGAKGCGLGVVSLKPLNFASML